MSESISEMVNQTMTQLTKAVDEKIRKVFKDAGADPFERRHCEKCGHEAAGWLGSYPGAHLLILHEGTQWPQPLAYPAQQDFRLEAHMVTRLALCAAI